MIMMFRIGFYFENPLQWKMFLAITDLEKTPFGVFSSIGGQTPLKNLPKS
ncbi:MAG: hypothetical protein Ct9H300mP3_03990 [Gammaproteobacteria bacterium]|nr:MAG: hypothetical protein Ct9H300mP3_03990 [Gammaproteobacteria bacterium]